MSEPQVHSGMAVIEPRQQTTVKLPEVHTPLSVRSHGLTDRGKVRPNNEDQFLVAALFKTLQVQFTSMPLPKFQRSSDRGYLFVVADGMGGHSGGEKASALAIDSVESLMLESFKWFIQFKGREEDKLLVEFQNALAEANARVLAEARAHPELHGMGTTLTLAFSLNDVLFVAHVGDSRCYLCRDNLLYRLTSDHTLVEEMVHRGALSAEEATQHRWRHVITNALGGNSPEIKVEVHKVQLEEGDAVLLCSDGLTEMLPDDEIARVLQAEDDPAQVCEQLVTRANENGGRDNITVVLARYEAAA